MNSFAVGDVVRLKTGGPKMTVVIVEKEVKAVWFVKDRSGSWAGPFFGYFAVAALEPCKARGIE